jgi:hypothetical protein
MRAACAALAVATLATTARAHADATDTLLAVGYVVPVGFGAVATAVNGTYLAYDEPAARAWRILGMTVGGVDTAIGGTLLVTSSDRSEGVALGCVALGVGLAALATGYFVAEDTVSVGVIHVAGGGALTLSGRF